MMELKKLLEYHTECLICHGPLRIKSPDLDGPIISVKPEGLSIKYSHNKRSIIFKYDGTYEKHENCADWRSRPLSILIECPHCIPKETKPKINRAATSFSPLSALKVFKFYYQFDLYGGIENKYNAFFKKEFIKCYDEEYFYHLITSEEASFIWYGRMPTQVKDNSYYNENCFSKVTPINTSKLTDINQLINKIKIYNIFS
jgi:hypothetical protein